MNFRSHKRRRDDQADLEITPLIDVVFLLLIFFMLTSTFAREQAGPTDQISVELPRVAAEEMPGDKSPIVVVVRSGGELSILGAGDGEAGDDESQKERTVSASDNVIAILRDVRDERPDAPILLTGDRRASHGRVVELLGQLRDAGFREVQIATQPAQSEQ